MSDLEKWIIGRISCEGEIGHGALVHEFSDCLEDLEDSGILEPHDHWDDSGYKLSKDGEEVARDLFPGAPK